jgi:hypothetical protein
MLTGHLGEEIRSMLNVEMEQNLTIRISCEDDIWINLLQLLPKHHLLENVYPNPFPPVSTAEHVAVNPLTSQLFNVFSKRR